MVVRSIDRAKRRAVALADYEHGYHPAGAARHAAAILANGDRRSLLARIEAPTLVVHGLDDPLVPVEAGRDTAARIAGAELVELPGMIGEGEGMEEAMALLSRLIDRAVPSGSFKELAAL